MPKPTILQKLSHRNIEITVDKGDVHIWNPDDSTTSIYLTPYETRELARKLLFMAKDAERHI